MSHENLTKMCNKLKVRLHELAKYLNFLLKHGELASDHQNIIQKAVDGIIDYLIFY